MQTKMSKEEVREGYIKYLDVRARQKKADADNYSFTKSIKLNKRIGRW